MFIMILLMMVTMLANLIRIAKTTRSPCSVSELLGIGQSEHGSNFDGAGRMMPSIVLLLAVLQD